MDALNRDEGRWGDVRERFGIPDPRQVQAEIDRICDEHLPTKIGGQPEPR